VERDRFEAEIFSDEVPDLDVERRARGATRTVTRDEGLRVTSLEASGGLRTLEECGMRTAGTCSEPSGSRAARRFSA
jgi:acetyl-CoA C-acetyltransferase